VRYPRLVTTDQLESLHLRKNLRLIGLHRYNKEITSFDLKKKKKNITNQVWKKIQKNYNALFFFYKKKQKTSKTIFFFVF